MAIKSYPAGLLTSHAFSAAEARASGVTRRQLRRRGLNRVTHGWYAIRDLDLAGRCQALLRTLPDDCCFSDVTAAMLFGLPLPLETRKQADVVHVTLSPRRTVPQRVGVRVHRRRMEPGDLHTHDGLPVIAPRRLMADLAPLLALEDLVALGDSILHKQLSTVEEIATTLGRRRPGMVRAREAARLIMPHSQSAPESVLRMRLVDAGVPVRPQVKVTAADGAFLGHADLGVEECKVAVEYEGRHHAEGAQFDDDIGRYSRFAAAGWLVVRAGRRDLADGSRALIARVRSACASRTDVPAPPRRP